MGTHSTSRRTLLGAVGTALVGGLAGCTGGAPGGDGGDGGDGGQQTPTPTPGPVAATVEVGPGSDLRFDPAEVTVSVGATIEWVWKSGGHSVTPETNGISWSGTGLHTHDKDYVHTHTFDTEGRYPYYCQPHRSAGMRGAVVVSGEATTDTGTGTPTTTTGGGGGDGGDGYY